MNSKTSLYGQFDFNTSQDPKIIDIELEFGMVSYAWFFKTLEILGLQNGHLDMNNSGIKSIAKKLEIDKLQAQKFIDYCIEIGLFFLTENNELFSKRFLGDINNRKSKAITNRENGKKGGRPPKSTKAKSSAKNQEQPITQTETQNNPSVTDAKPIGNNPITIEENSIVYNSIEKKRKEEEKKEKKLPSQISTEGQHSFDPTPEELARENEISISHSKTSFKKAEIPIGMVRRIK